MVEEEESLEVRTASLRLLSAVLLGLLMGGAFVGNAALAATIGASATLRTGLLHAALANIALLNLLDVAVNAFISLLFVARDAWGQSAAADAVCSLNAALTVFVPLQLLLAIAFLAADRTVALIDHANSQSPAYQQRMTPLRSLLSLHTTSLCCECGAFRFFMALLLVWLLGICFTVPITIGSVPSKMYTARYLCAIHDGPLGIDSSICEQTVISRDRFAKGTS